MYFTVEEENLLCLYHNAGTPQDSKEISGQFCRIWTRKWLRWPARPPISWTP